MTIPQDFMSLDPDTCDHREKSAAHKFFDPGIQQNWLIWTHLWE